jgi:Membrane magnesium transporter
VWDVAKQQGLPLETRQVTNWPVLTSEQTLNKVSWKKVTQEMERQGSYPYGFTTTKKKYFDVVKGKA